jgi:hypothetical protein
MSRYLGAAWANMQDNEPSIKEFTGDQNDETKEENTVYGSAENSTRVPGSCEAPCFVLRYNEFVLTCQVFAPHTIAGFLGFILENEFWPR